MTNVYKALTPEEQEFVYMQAIGKDIYSSFDSNFCKGSFGMCHDDVGEPWWNSWNALQRDVLFFYRYDDDWMFHCQYSLNTYSAEIGNTIKELLNDIQENSNVTVDEIKTEILDQKSSPSQEEIEENNILVDVEDNSNITVTVEKTEKSEMLDHKKPPLQQETISDKDFDFYDIIEEMSQNTMREDIDADPSTIAASATEFTSFSSRIKPFVFIYLSVWTLMFVLF